MTHYNNFITLKANCQFIFYADSIFFMELREIFISNMKRYRKNGRISQMKLAERCNTSTSYIGEIEIGKKFPSVEMIQKIATALDIQPFQLFMQDSDLPNTTFQSTEKKTELIYKLQQAITKIINEENI